MNAINTGYEIELIIGGWVVFCLVLIIACCMYKGE